MVLPVTLAVTSVWIEDGRGAPAARAATTVQAYAAALLALDIGTAAPPLDAQFLPYAGGTTSCSDQGDGCSCSIRCSGSSRASCTSCTRCVCVIGATGSGTDR